ncbi:MAG: hypothetical protein Q7R30_19435 [Acidobacteriota bacterium]|nr:hypothetical protein [Acidobacteriota bacterium]
MRVAFGLLLLSTMLLSACSSVMSRKYEYEEEVFLALDRSATVNVNASVPALVALRGLDLPVDPNARLDLQKVRGFYETPVTRVASVTSSRRDGRRYVHLRIEVANIQRLSEAAPFSWSATAFIPRSDGIIFYAHRWNLPAGEDVGDVGWNGTERVAFRLHIPSRVTFHDSPSGIERGNILVWEQLLTDRLKNVVLAGQVRMESESILNRTLSLFAAMMAAVVVTFAAAIWFVKTRKVG